MPRSLLMQISTLDILIIVLYLIAALGIGLYQALKVKSSGDYYAGGRKFNKFYLMMHALGTASHADEPVSVIGGAYEKGLSGIWYTYLYLPLTPIFWLLAPYIRRTRFITMADFFRTRYDRSLAILYSIMGVLKMSVSIAVILKGTTAIIRSVSGGSINDNKTIMAMTVVFVIYGFAGGLRATIVTESIQGPLIVLMSLLIVPFGLYKLGGFHNLHAAISSSMFSLTLPRDPSSPGEFTPAWIIAASLTALIGFVAEPGIIAAFGSGKTELEGRVGYTYGTMIKRVCAMGWVFTGILLAGMVARGIVPHDNAIGLGHDRERAFGTAMQAMLPTGLLGLMIAAILSAQMATLSALMVNSSALAARNLYKGVFRPLATDKEVLIFGRIAGLCLVSIGVFLARSLGTVADSLTMLLQFSSIMGVVVWAGVLWRRATSKGAWAAVIVLFLTWATLGPVGDLIKKRLDAPPATSATQPSAATNKPSVLPSWVGRYAGRQFIPQLMIRYLPTGVATLVLVSLLTKPRSKKQIDDFFLLLKTPVGQEQKLIDAGVPMIYAGNSQANALETKYPRLIHWGGCALAAVICVLILGLLKLLASLG